MAQWGDEAGAAEVEREYGVVRMAEGATRW
jgi:hypothetical protein